MDVHQVRESCYILSFELACIFEIRKKMRDLHGDDLEAWSNFKRKFRDEFYDKDFDRVTKRSFF